MTDADKYRETIAVAHLSLTQQHAIERGDWPGFQRNTEHLFRPELLLNYYTPQVRRTAYCANVRHAFRLLASGESSRAPAAAYRVGTIGPAIPLV